MTDFERFIKVNELKKKDVASFLDVSNAFITQLCKGLCELPDAQLKKIKGNPHGWDTSMFVEKEETPSEKTPAELLEIIASQQETIRTQSETIATLIRQKHCSAQQEECADSVNVG